MNSSFRYKLLILAFSSCFSLVIPSPLSNEQRQQQQQLTPKDYLISRNDIDATLSKIIRPNDQIAILSDFDGTLAEINANPYQTVIKPETKRALDRLATRSNVFMAIISGRQLINLECKININNITYCGNHGMEMIWPNGTEWKYPITPEIYANCSMIKDILSVEYGMDKCGGWVEDKGTALVYNYHGVPFEDRENVINEIRQIVYDHGFIPIAAHDAIDIKPPVVWNKGHAALMIMEEFFGSDWNSQNIRVLFMGDDNSDEDAMEMLKGKGTSFRITSNPNLATHADFRIQSTDTVVHILEWLIDNIHF